MHCARKLIPCLLKHTWHDLDAWQIMLTSWVFNAADWTKQTCCSKSHKPYVSKKVESNNVYNLLIKSYFIYLPSYITFKTREKKTWKKAGQPSNSRTYSDTVIIRYHTLSAQSHFCSHLMSWLHFCCRPSPTEQRRFHGWERPITVDGQHCTGSFPDSQWPSKLRVPHVDGITGSLSFFRLLISQFPPIYVACCMLQENV